MKAFPDIGAHAQFARRAYEGPVLGAPGDFADFVGGSAPRVDLDWRQAPWLAAEAPVAEGGAARVLEGFDIASIRPAQAPWPSASERPPARSESWGAAISFGLHGAALLALLVWSTPLAETPPPEIVTVEIVNAPPANAPADVSPPAESAPAAAVDATPPVAETPSPVVAAPPPPAPKPPDLTPAPASTAQTPPTVEPPPIAEASPPPAPEIAEPSPTAVAQAPVPAPSKPEGAAEGPAPPPTVRPSPRVVAAPALKPPPPAPVKTRPTPPRPTTTRAQADSAPTVQKPARSSLATQQPAASAADIAAYQGAVFGRIRAQKRYPEAARERAPHGVAVVNFSIAPSGQLASAAIAQSAGDPILDAEALATVRRAGPFPPPPAGAPRNFSAPLSYRIR